jgi:hypothetical protein
MVGRCTISETQNLGFLRDLFRMPSERPDRRSASQVLAAHMASASEPQNLVTLTFAEQTCQAPREPKPTYRLTLQAEPGEVPAIVRLRRFLKAALRTYGLRATEVAEIPANLDNGRHDAKNSRGPDA